MSPNFSIISSFLRHGYIKLGRLGCLTFKTCLPLSVLLGLATPSIAQQQVIYGRGPLIGTPVLPGTEGGYQLDSGVACPTPSFSVGGYGGAGNDWANNDVPYASSNSGINNFGIAAGVRVPFGGDLGRFCKDFAKAKANFEQTRYENQLRDAQLTLLRQCMWLKNVGIKLGQKAFEGPYFSTLSPCKQLDLDRTSATLPFLKPDTKEEISAPPASDTKPFSSPTTVIQDQRFR